MDPARMKWFAEKTEDFRVTIEDLQDNFVKMLSDVFEALVAAIFLDTGGDLGVTH